MLLKIMCLATGKRDAKCRRAAIRKNRWMNEHLNDVVEVL